MNEGEFQTKMLKYLRDLGGDGHKSRATERGGYPDLCCAMPGELTWLIEVKLENEEPTKLQKVTARKLIQGGFNVALVRVYPGKPYSFVIKANFETNELGQQTIINEWPQLIWKNAVLRKTKP